MVNEPRRPSLTRRRVLLGAAAIAANALAACGGEVSVIPSATAIPRAGTRVAPVSVPPVAEVFAPPPGSPVTPLIVFVGDSIVYGENLLRTETFPAQTMALLAPARYDAVNLGVRGQMVVELDALAPGTVDPLFAAGRGANIVVACIGTNDLTRGAGDTPTYDGIVAFGQGRRRVGFKVVMATILPRTGLLGTVAERRFEAERQAVNARIRSNLAGFADALADVGADPTIGAPGATANREYFQGDGTHPTARGGGIIAGIVTAAILTL